MHWGQLANFKIDHRLESNKYADALNYYLPDDIRILNSDSTTSEFNSRFDAQSKRYRYLIGLDRTALYYDYRWEMKTALNYELLQQAAELVVGDHDFAPFCVLSSRKENNHCLIYHSKWRKVGDLLIYEVRGNRFLHSMIRSLVGGMVNLAKENSDKNESNLTLPKFKDIIESSTDERVKFTAPACGLYLVSVMYPN